MNDSKKMKQLVAVVERQGADGDDKNKKSFWTRIGVAFENKDGSWNLRFDYLPTRPDTTIQMRDMDPPKEPKAA